MTNRPGIVAVSRSGDTAKLVLIGEGPITSRIITNSSHPTRIDRLFGAINKELLRRLDAAVSEACVERDTRIAALKHQLTREQGEHRVEMAEVATEKVRTFNELRAATLRLREAADAFVSMRGALDDIPGNAEHGGLLGLIRRVLALEENGIVRYLEHLGRHWCGLTED